MWLRAGVLVLGLASCVQPELIECGELLCPAGSVCTPLGCADRSSLDACRDLGDGDSCVNSGVPGICSGGACVPTVCGDGRVVGREVCDDRNQLAGDGCSADCVSDETCGNDYIDVVRNEQCDEGVRGLARDGCTSTCTLELDTWVDISPTLPIARASFGIAYDSRRHRTVVFGGASNISFVGDTWEWDGATWREFHPTVSPSLRAGAAMAYDSDRGVVVLFGGADNIDTFGDTWEWDGITWTERMPATLPAPRGYTNLVYDPVRKETVMFGSSAELDTWVWNGTDWAKRPGNTPPSVNVAMAWDAQSNRVLLYAGANATTWAWNGTAWQEVQPATQPPMRQGMGMSSSPSGRVLMYGGMGRSDTYEWVSNNWVPRASAQPGNRENHGMVFDGERNRVVLFGGIANGTFSSEIYEWQPTQFTLRTTVAAPSARFQSAAVYQPLRGTMLMFGGFSNDETWEWDGLAWARYTPATRPAARVLPAMSATRDRVLLFGGRASNCEQDTWEWSGSAWMLMNPPQKPSRRQGASMAYDSKHDRVVLFGGADDAQVVNAETWEWNGTTWEPRTPAVSPPPRWGATLAYDPVRERMVLFGGDNGAFSGNLHDTWEWDGTTWTEMDTTELAPHDRMFATSAYDAARKTVLLFGGLSGEHFSDTWEWNGVRWQKLESVIEPNPRMQHVMAYDPIRGELVVFGGQVFLTAQPDTVAHRFASRAFPADACVDVDTDGDKLAGCDDPDCWGRCTPQCPPGAPCDPAAPHCGDGECSVLEDRRLCPVDCSQ